MLFGPNFTLKLLTTLLTSECIYLPRKEKERRRTKEGGREKERRERGGRKEVWLNSIYNHIHDCKTIIAY